MLKRFSLLLLTLCLSIGLIPLQYVGAVDTISLTFFDELSATSGEETTVNVVNLTLDGVPLTGTMPAINSGGRTLVPVRLVAEALGAEVIWVNSTRQVILLKETDTIVLTLGSAQAVYNGTVVTLPDEIPATIVGYNDTGNTMVPLRFVSEQLGATVEWDNDSYTAIITSPTGTETQTPEVEETPAPTPSPNGLTSVSAITTDNQSVYIQTSVTPEYYIMDLGDRVTIDIMNATIFDVLGSISINNDVIDAVRYAQYNEDIYDSQLSVRVVLDLKDGYSLSEHLSIALYSGGIQVTTSSTTIPDTTTEEENDYESTFTLSTPINPSSFTIVLDPGHGGDNPGASYEDIDEKDIVLPISQKLETILMDLGYSVVMTRYDDSTVDLYDRAEIANAVNADIFVSIHANASAVSDTFEGIFTYHYPGSQQGEILAQMIQTPVCETTGAIDRGILSNDYVVLRETTMPAVLVETGFMSASAELARLVDDSYQEMLAIGMAEGIIQYLNSLT